MMDRRGLLAGAAALGLAGPVLAAGVSVLPDVETPFKMEGGRPWTGVWLNKQGPFRFAIMSGTNNFSVWDDLAAKLKLNPTTSNVRTASRNHGPIATIYEVEEMLVGGAFALTRVPVTTFSTGGQPMDLGHMPLIADRVTTFDFKAGIMRSLRDLPADRAGYARAPMIYQQNVVTWVPQVLGKLGGKTVRLRISTGSPGVISLSPQAVNRLGFWNDEARYSERAFEEGVRERTQRLTRRGDLELGDVKIANPLVMLNKSGGAAWVDIFDDDGTIGIDLLRRYDLIIDQPKRGLWMRPNADFDEPFTYDRAGFDVEEKDGQWFASVVDKGSPAEAAGLKVGDRILTEINSVRRARFAPPGAKVAFSVISGGQRGRVEMTLADWL